LEPGTHYSTDVPGIYFNQKTIGRPAQSRYVNTREPTLFTYVGFFRIKMQKLYYLMMLTLYIMECVHGGHVGGAKQLATANTLYKWNGD